MSIVNCETTPDPFVFPPLCLSPFVFPFLIRLPSWSKVYVHMPSVVISLLPPVALTGEV